MLVTMIRLANNVAWGIRRGVVFASVYAAWAVVLLVARGSAPFKRYGTTFGATIALYFVGGVAAGAIVGALRPLAQWRAGAAAVGVVAATPVYLATMLVLEGPGWFAPSETPITGIIFGWALFAGFGGSMSGLILREIFTDN